MFQVDFGQPVTFLYCGKADGCITAIRYQNFTFTGG